MVLSKLLSRQLVMRAMRARTTRFEQTRGEHFESFAGKRDRWDSKYWGYREPNYRPRLREQMWVGNFMGAVFWWWTLYHFYYEFGHIAGEFPFYDPYTDFTDENLGIPDDSYGLAPTIDNPRSAQIVGCTRRNWKLPPYALERWYHDTGAFKF